MYYETDTIGDVTLISVLLNKATVEDASSFKNYLMDALEKGAVKVLIDLSRCAFVDSTFLGALVAGLKKASSHSSDLRLLINKDTPSSVFVLTRMDKVFKIFSNYDEAIGSFN